MEYLALCEWCCHLSWSPLAPFPLGIVLRSTCKFPVEVPRGVWHKRVTLLGNATPLCPGMAQVSRKQLSHGPPNAKRRVGREGGQSKIDNWSENVEWKEK